MMVFRDVGKRYGEVTALAGVNWEIAAGTSVALVGADGSGKTTLLRLAVGLERPDSGTIVRAPEVASADRCGYMPQRFSLYRNLTVAEQLRLSGALFGLGAAGQRRAEELLAFVGLAAHREKSVGALSGGMKQKLALATALLHRPRLLLLDEPTVGVDALARREFWGLLQAVHEEGVTLAVATPDTGEAVYCERVAYLREGRICGTYTPAEWLRRTGTDNLEAALAQAARRDE